MKIRIVAWGVFFCLLLAGNGYGQVDRSEEVKVLMAGLHSGSRSQRINTAKLITQSGIVDHALYKEVASLLKAGYAEGIETDHVDEMSWLCKALAASGDPQYESLLTEIAEKSPSTKLQHYAKQSKSLLGEYADRIKILNSTEAWDAQLSEEENRLVNMLSSDNLALKRDAAKRIVRSVGIHQKVYDVAETELKEMLSEIQSDTVYIDTMAWLCKTLASSGNAEFIETLEMVRAGTQDFKLQTYATNALKDIK